MNFHKEVDEIRRKQLNNPWPKFLESVQIQGFRGWNDTEVRFQFPLCVVAGENGSGKSTLLKAAASAYIHPSDPARTFYPSSFFPDTPWDKVTNANLRFKIREGTQLKEFSIKKVDRWCYPRSRPKRYVLWQDISRTVPINAIVGYAYIAKRTALETSAIALDEDSTTYFSSIMGRPYQTIRFAQTNVDPVRPVGVVKQSGIQYSQFHQGAGEDSTLDLLSLLQTAPDTSLVIIDEIEASLHPRAQRRIVHYLLWLARTRQIQVLLSTHSSYIIEEIPPEGRIFLECSSGNVEPIYGVTSKFALGRMDDYNPPEFYLFTEDVEASVVVKAILRKQAVDLSRLAIIDVGPANVVSAVGIALSRKNTPIPTLGILDPD
jgi:predicted ATPase